MNNSFLIKQIEFSNQEINELRKDPFGQNWPVVYILKSEHEAYIGETSNVLNRLRQHRQNPERQRLNKAYLIYDPEYNKSATLDIESKLLNYFSGEITKSFKVQNLNIGQSPEHEYYNREKYNLKFREIWSRLKDLKIVQNQIESIENLDLFKFSPYKSLKKEQIEVVNDIYSTIITDSFKNKKTFIIEGGPGTGKTLVAISLFKKILDSFKIGLHSKIDYLDENDNEELILLLSKIKARDISIAFVVPMTSLRETLRNVFGLIGNGLKKSMVIGPNDVMKKKYDVLIVDEAHRLKKPFSLGAEIGSFQQINRTYFPENLETTQLDWVLKNSTVQVLFYDQSQSVRPSDIDKENIENLKRNYENISKSLNSQFRCQAGEDFIEYINEVFSSNPPSKRKFSNYEIILFEHIANLKNSILNKETEFKLSRIVAGFAWEWKTKNSKDLSLHDFEIEGIKFRWNSTTQDWINFSNSINEVGCIHTTQGYDLNFVGVIFGPELSYDFVNRKFILDIKHFNDTNTKKGISKNPDKILNYVLNSYKVMLTRGIKGLFIYAVDPKLRKYLSQFFDIL